MKHVEVQNGNLYRYLLDPFGKIVAGKLSFLTCSIHLQIVSCDSLKCGVGVSHPKIDPASFNMIHLITLRFLTWWCATEHLFGMVSCSMHPLSQWLLLGMAYFGEKSRVQSVFVSTHLTNHPVGNQVSKFFFHFE